MIVVLCLLLLAGGGTAIYYFCSAGRAGGGTESRGGSGSRGEIGSGNENESRDEDGDQSDGGVKAAERNIIGCWYGASDGEEAYMQFSAGGAMDIVSPGDDVWLTSEFRLIRRQNEVTLQIFDPEHESWEVTSSIEFADQNTLIVIDDYSGMRIPMERISEESFEKVLGSITPIDTRIE